MLEKKYCKLKVTDLFLKDKDFVAYIKISYGGIQK